MVAKMRGAADQLGRELADIRRTLGDVRTARPEPTETIHEEPPPRRSPNRSRSRIRRRSPAYSEPEPEPEPAPEPEPEPEYVAPPEPDYLAPQPEDESLKLQGDELQPTEEHVPPPAPEREPYQPEAEPEPVAEAEPGRRPAGGGGGGSSEGARLIALNMALNGTPREETAAYLADNFDLPDQDAFLDEVYSRAGS